MRTVENRWLMSTVMPPVVCGQRRAAVANRSKSGCSVGASRLAVGSSSSSRRGASRIIARPSAIFCHCPIESSTPSNCRPSWVSRPSSSSRNKVGGDRAVERADESASSVDARAASPAPIESRASSSRRTKSWNPAESRVATRRSERSEVDAVDEDRPAGRLVEPSEELDERGLAGDPFSPTIGDGGAGR